MPVSHDTLVRLMRRSLPDDPATPRVLGIDDFAWKRGRRYGTIFIDQARHLVVDVLLDWETETLVKWLETHPGIEIVSRDRAGNYADAVRRGAPQAKQVADRFHLLMNLHATLARFFERKHHILKRITAESQAETQQLYSQAPSSACESKDEPKPLTPTQAQKLACQTRRKNRYEEVIKMHEPGRYRYSAWIAPRHCSRVYQGTSISRNCPASPKDEQARSLQKLPPRTVGIGAP
jgi:transposase